MSILSSISHLYMHHVGCPPHLHISLCCAPSLNNIIKEKSIQRRRTAHHIEPLPQRAFYLDGLDLLLQRTSQGVGIVSGTVRRSCSAASVQCLLATL
jgi:hypothetical protein